MKWNAVCRNVAWLTFALLFSTFSFAQNGAVQRINRPVNDADVALLPGGVHPHVAQSVDQGRLPAGMPLQRMAIFFKPSATQQSDLDELLRQQQDPVSPNYHKWLTPEEYGARFGMNPDDLTKVSVWLQAHGFQNIAVSRSRNSIDFDGNAGQAAAAFRTSIHQVRYHGEIHYANINSPQVPSAFAATVSSIRSLNNFRPRAMSVAHLTSNISGNHFLVPGDVGTIYNINSLYNSGVKGDGQSIAVVGQTLLTANDDHTHADIDTFRSLSGLPAINLQFVKTGSPTYSTADVDEANLDLEWSGAIAPNAQIFFVYSDNALFTSLAYIVHNKVTSVVSISYGNCEANFESGSVTTLINILQQANAQGQTLISASGDSGAADCDGTVSSPVTQATKGLAVDIPASTPYVVGMGGTQFSADSTATFTCNPPGSTNCIADPDPPYWNGSNSLTDTTATALTYIPEAVWNSTASAGSLSAGGGGISKLFSRPSWQAATDFQATSSLNSISLTRGNSTQAKISATDAGQRGVPDISLSSSPDHDGYIICSQGSCQNAYRRSSDNTFNVIGGTSAAAPVFAGVVALLNQKLGTAVGPINQNLYSLASNSSNVFHDITSGDNKVPCQQGTTDCPNGGSIGYSAGPGYDLASGLGSIDVGALVAAWPNSTTPPPTQFPGTITLSCSVSASLGNTTCSVSPTTIATGQSATLTVVATSSAALHRNGLPGRPWALELGLGLAAMCFMPVAGHRGRGARLLRNGILSTMALLFVLGLIACGGGGSNSNNNNNSFTPLSGSVTVQAVSGSLNHTVVIPVTIN